MRPIPTGSDVYVKSDFHQKLESGKIAMIALSKMANNYVQSITTAWQKSFESILLVCGLLKDAQDELSAVEYHEMIKRLPFSSNVAEKLCKIANDKRITNPKNAESLPPHWTTLYEISSLEDSIFKQALNDKVIHPSVQREEIIQYKSQIQSASSPKSSVPKPSIDTSKFASVSLPIGFDMDAVDDLQKALQKVADAYKVHIEFNQKGVVAFKRLELAKELEKWLENRKRGYRKDVSDKDIRDIELALEIVTGKVEYHSGTIDISQNKFIKMTPKEIHAFCRERKILTKYDTLKNVDREANIKQTLLDYCKGDSQGRAKAKRKLERLATSKNSKSQEFAKNALKQIIE